MSACFVRLAQLSCVCGVKARKNGWMERVKVVCSKASAFLTVTFLCWLIN